MASGNQGVGRRGGEGRREGHNGGSQNPKEQQGRAIPQAAEHLGNRIREGYDSAQEAVSHNYRQAEGTIARNPGSSLLVAFGLGMGLGLVITTLIAHEEESWSDRHLPDSLRHLPDSVDRLRRKVPREIAQSHIADSFHSLSESIRDLPSAISRLIPGR